MRNPQATDIEKGERVGKTWFVDKKGKLCLRGLCQIYFGKTFKSQEVQVRQCQPRNNVQFYLLDTATSRGSLVALCTVNGERSEPALCCYYPC